MQDFTFIIKQIAVNAQGEKIADSDADTEQKPGKISKEEQRMYDTLSTANSAIKHFEVEQ